MNEQTMHGGNYAQRGFVFQRKVTTHLVLEHLHWLESFTAEPSDKRSIDLEVLFSEKRSPYGEKLMCKKLLAQIKSGEGLHETNANIKRLLKGTFDEFLDAFESINDLEYHSFGILTESIQDLPRLHGLKADLELIRSNAQSGGKFGSRGKEDALQSINKIFGTRFDEDFLRRVFVDDRFKFETDFDLDHLVREFRFGIMGKIGKGEEEYRILATSPLGIKDVIARVESVIEEASVKGKTISGEDMNSLLVRTFVENYSPSSFILGKRPAIQKELPWFEEGQPFLIRPEQQTGVQTVSAGASIVK